MTELCTNEINKEWLKYGPYYFNPERIKYGNSILSIDILSGVQLIIIDEIGPLEINGQGWCSAIEKITSGTEITQLRVVRKGLVKKFTRKWNTGNVYIFDVNESSLQEVEEKIIEIIK